MSSIHSLDVYSTGLQALYSRVSNQGKFIRALMYEPGYCCQQSLLSKCNLDN